MNTKRLCLLLLSVLPGVPITASAAVTDAAANGFAVHQELAIKAPADTIWRMLVSHTGEWWHSDHTYSGDAKNLYIEQRAPGCFCERLGDNGTVVHMMVTVVDPPRMLRLTGGLGPLGLMGIDGNLTFSLTAGEGLTIVRLDYAVGGYSKNGLDSIAPAVDRVLGEQLARLRALVETGSAAKPKAAQ